MKNLININNKLYEVIRVIKVSRIGEESDKVKVWVDFHFCDRAFKKDDHYYLVKDVIDVEPEVIENEEITTTK